MTLHPHCPHRPKDMFFRSSRGRHENNVETSQINLPGTSLGRQVSTSPGRHFETTQDVRSGLPRDTTSGCPQDGQIQSLGDVLRNLQGDILGTSSGQIFAIWVMACITSLIDLLYLIKISWCHWIVVIRGNFILLICPFCFNIQLNNYLQARKR